MMNKREEIQFQAIKAWVDNNKRGTIILPTGVGKTYVGSIIVSKLYSNKVISSILIVVPTTNLIGQWKKVLQKVSPGMEDIAVVKCLKGVYDKKQEYDLMIVDEAHTSLSPEYRAIYSNTKYKYLLDLTATEPGNEEYQRFLETVAPVVYKTVLNALEGTDTVADYKMYNIEINFFPKDRAKYSIFDNQFKTAQMGLMQMKKAHKLLKDYTVFDLAKAFNSDNGAAVEFSFIKESVDAKKLERDLLLLENDLSKITKYAKKYWSGMTMRKWVCYESEAKIHNVKLLLQKFPDRKWIIFNKSIKFAERLRDEIPNSYIYHSKLKNNEREQVLKDYHADPKGVLIAVDALNAGLDIQDADAAITVSGVSTELIGVQQLG